MRSRTKNSSSESNKIEQAPVAREQVSERQQSVIGASLQFTGEIVKQKMGYRQLAMVRAADFS